MDELDPQNTLKSATPKPKPPHPASTPVRMAFFYNAPSAGREDLQMLRNPIFGQSVQLAGITQPSAQVTNKLFTGLRLFSPSPLARAA
jgi:hypothetical protein